MMFVRIGQNSTFRREERVEGIVEPMSRRPVSERTNRARAVQRGGETRGEYCH